MERIIKFEICERKDGTLKTIRHNLFTNQLPSVCDSIVLQSTNGDLIKYIVVEVMRIYGEKSEVNTIVVQFVKKY